MIFARPALIVLAVLLATAPVVLARSHDEVQAPRGQEVQAPRAQDIQAPRGDEIQAPRHGKGPDVPSMLR